MHRLPNRQTVRRIRMVAWLMLFNRLSLTTAPLLLIYSLVVEDRYFTRVALILMGLAVLVTVIQWVAAARIRCPLCLGLPLSHNRCVKNREARQLLGSYRLRVAQAVVLEGRFRCPYCGEITAVQARRRVQGGYQA